MEHHEKEMIETIECESAVELIGRLRPENPDWRGAQSYWGFRGQRDASWKLVPAAFRPDWEQFIHITRRSREGTALRRQLDNELRGFIDFAALADEVGYYLPGAEQLFNAETRRKITERLETYMWPPDSLIEGLAIAQHHGVPTRLIDFTYSPLVAAFFAAHNCMQLSEKDRPGCMAVWGINLRFLESAWAFTYPFRRTDIAQVRVMASRNPFLRAQNAFFLLDWKVDPAEMIEPPFSPPIEERITEIARIPETWTRVDNRGAIAQLLYPPIIKRFLLPSGEAKSLLEHLFLEKISPVHLMPTLNNVTATLSFMRDIRNEGLS